MMIYSEILAADCESLGGTRLSPLAKAVAEAGTWITHDSRQSILKVVDDTRANNLGRIFVSMVDTDNVKSKNQDRESIPHEQKQLILSNLNGVETSTTALSCFQSSRVPEKRHVSSDPQHLSF